MWPLPAALGQVSTPWPVLAGAVSSARNAIACLLPSSYYLSSQAPATVPVCWENSDAPGHRLQNPHRPRTWLSFLMTLWAASVLVFRLRARSSISSASFSWRFWCCCRTRSSSAADCFSSPGLGPATPLTPHMGGRVDMRWCGGGEETNMFPGNPQVMATATALLGAQFPLLYFGFWEEHSQKCQLMGALDACSGASVAQGLSSPPAPAVLPKG